MEWTIGDPVVDPNLLAIAFGLKVMALTTFAVALLGVVLGEVYPARAERFARVMLGAYIVEGLPLIVLGMTAGPGLGGVAFAGALLVALGLGVPAFFGAVESFSRLANAVTDAVDDKVRRWREREWRVAPGAPEVRHRGNGAVSAGPAQARPPGILPSGGGRGGVISGVAPDEVRRTRGAVVMGLAWAAMGWLGVHVAQGAGGGLAPFFDSFAGLVRFLGLVLAGWAGLELLVNWLERRQGTSEEGWDVDAGS